MGFPSTPGPGRLVIAARRVIHDSLPNPLRLDEVARAVGCSKYHLCREFKLRLGLTVQQYQMRLRLREALRRLSTRMESLTALALDLGFSSHSHFTAAFRREFGLPPSEVLKLCCWARTGRGVQLVPERVEE